MKALWSRRARSMTVTASLIMVMYRVRVAARAAISGSRIPVPQPVASLRRAGYCDLLLAANVARPVEAYAGPFLPERLLKWFR